MSIILNRRSLMLTGGAGLGALLLPIGRATAQAIAALRGFTHNVASGEPGPDSVLLWTRYVPANGGPVKVRVEISSSPDFTKIAGGGEITTGPWRDYTVKITVDGLAAGATHYYRFIAPDGSMSPVGRTKTLPVGPVKNFNIAIFSCSNLGFGHFNAYGHAAARKDIDLALHMGDYIYEYARGGYDSGATSARVLGIEPAGEIVTLSDYRFRYASYRLDPDLQALHQNVPMICNTDDHESANDSWEGGAQNHQPDEGDWNNRRNAAMQVWREWLPIGESPWARYDFGDLGSYLRTDTRTVARSRPPFYGDVIRQGANAEEALKAFRDGAWQDAAATMLGTEQESWLHRQIRSIAREKRVWTVVGSGTNMGYNRTPAEAIEWLGPNPPERNRSWAANGLAAAKLGLPYNPDNWGGYPKARNRLLSAAQSAGSNLVVVTGDSHNGWAFDLPANGKAAGVEFGGHSVSSPGFENATKGVDPATVAKALLASSDELRWADTSNRGYMVVSLTPGTASNEWVFMADQNKRSIATKPSQRMSAKAGRNILEKI
jgi:alkaline phosphatase D